MLFKGSRYTTSTIVEATDASGRTTRALSMRVIAPPPSALAYTVTEGERLDMLAARFYGEATKYWHILDANPETLNPFELLVPGRTIQVPRNKLVGP